MEESYFPAFPLLICSRSNAANETVAVDPFAACVCARWTISLFNFVFFKVPPQLNIIIKQAKSSKYGVATNACLACTFGCKYVYSNASNLWQENKLTSKLL